MTPAPNATRAAGERVSVDAAALADLVDVVKRWPSTSPADIQRVALYLAETATAAQPARAVPSDRAVVEAAVEAYGVAKYEAGQAGFPNGGGGDSWHASALHRSYAALLAAHAAAVQAADAAGYARAMAEVDAACASLYDHDGGGRVVMIGQTRARHRGKWHAWPEEVYEPPAPDAPTATAALIAAAATLAAAATPTLVNGGPPRDGLDDGR